MNPALADLPDGRRVVYGTMGGDGQPQTQAAIFSRYALFGQDLQPAVSAPRWVLGRTWGESTHGLKLESRFDAALVAKLTAAAMRSNSWSPSRVSWGMRVRWSGIRMGGSREPPTRAATAEWGCA